MKQIEKVVVNSGIGRLSTQPNFQDKILPNLVSDFAAITGQKPSERAAKKSISSFKLRQGTIVGLKSTLRRQRMQQFLQKVVKVVLPRVRDFQGIDPKNIDTRGILTFGIKDHYVFPEVFPDASKPSFGIEVTVVPKDEKKLEEAVEFYRELGVPFAKESEKDRKHKR